MTEHWDGVSWHVVPSPNASTFTQSLTDVSGASAEDVWAVGWFYGDDGERALIEHWDGTQWRVVPSPDPTPYSEDLVRLTGIDAISSTDAWAVGMLEVASSFAHPRTLIEHWDGSTWTVVNSKDPSRSWDSLAGVSAASATDVWAVGIAGSDEEAALIEHWDGSRWTVVPSEALTNPSLVLNDVSAIPDGQAWAVGHLGSPASVSGAVEHWDGTAWKIARAPDGLPEGSDLTSVSAVAGNDVWAVGNPDSGSGTIIEHWDGSTWQMVPSPDLPTSSGGLHGVSAVPGAAWAVGSYAVEAAPAEHPVVDSWNGGAWRFLGPHARVLNLASIRVTTSVRSARGGDRVVFEAHASNLDRHTSELWVEYRDPEDLRVRREICVDGPSADSPSCEFSGVAAGGDVVVKVHGIIRGDGPYAMLTFCALRIDSPTTACKTGRIRITP